MVVRLHPEALAEYAEAAGFYEERVPGLAREFFDEVQRVLRVIEENPALGTARFARSGHTALMARMRDRQLGKDGQDVTGERSCQRRVANL